MTKRHLIDNLADAGATISRLLTTLVGDATVFDDDRPESKTCPPVPRLDGRQIMAELVGVVTRLNEVIAQAA